MSDGFRPVIESLSRSMPMPISCSHIQFIWFASRIGVRMSPLEKLFSGYAGRYVAPNTYHRHNTVMIKPSYAYVIILIKYCLFELRGCLVSAPDPRAWHSSPPNLHTFNSFFFHYTYTSQHQLHAIPSSTYVDKKGVSIRHHIVCTVSRKRNPSLTYQREEL